MRARTRKRASIKLPCSSFSVLLVYFLPGSEEGNLRGKKENKSRPFSKKEMSVPFLYLFNLFEWYRMTDLNLSARWNSGVFSHLASYLHLLPIFLQLATEIKVGI